MKTCLCGIKYVIKFCLMHRRIIYYKALVFEEQFITNYTKEYQFKEHKKYLKNKFYIFHKTRFTYKYSFI